MFLLVLTFLFSFLPSFLFFFFLSSFLPFFLSSFLPFFLSSFLFLFFSFLFFSFLFFSFLFFSFLFFSFLFFSFFSFPCFFFPFFLCSFFFFLFFTCFPLLALVSVFICKCFPRCRCYMEMWCPDVTGRKSWVWVGPPGREHDSTPWSGAGWELLAAQAHRRERKRGVPGLDY